MKRRRWILAGVSGLALLVPFVTPPGADAQCALGVPVIRVGVQGSSSGAHADYGRQIQMGATMAVEEINAAGGVLGCKLEMKFVDEELKPASAVKNARYLVTEWGAHFLVGVDSSGSAMAIGPVLPELKRIHFFTHAATHRLTEELVAQKGIQEIVRVSVPVYQESLAAWVFKDRPEIKRFATIGADYEYGYSTWNLFKETMKKFRPDAEFVAAAWAPFWTMDFSPHIAAVMAQKPDAIIATPWAGEAVMLLRQALLQGVFDKIQVWFQGMGGSVDVLEGITREVQQDKFKGKLWATARYIHNWPDTPENKAFNERFDKRWGRLPNYSAETTYSAIYIAKAAVEKAKSLETPKVLEALKGMQIQTPAGLRVFREEDHQFVYNVPAGRVVWDPKYPIAVLGDLKVVPAKDYYRYPPFTPVAATK
ncbi:MAG TPA: ABC transporter substrate-binding protein [Candidatus Methylomirabilis sp.]|nr:ABC transporter substrate-binding protein [Candidatus Methylomirabilis sp.]